MIKKDDRKDIEIIKDVDVGEIIIISIIITTLVCLLFEGGLMLYAYLNADKVTCNLLWCEFTQERTSIQSITSIDSKCSVNGVEVNCSEFKERYPDYLHYINYDTGDYELNGVCPSWHDNRSIVDCLNEVEDNAR